MKKTVLLFCLIACILQVYAQQRTITGTVIGKSDGQPLPGAAVLVKGTTMGMICDLDGKYSIKVPGDAKTLVFSFVGYVPQEVEIGAQTVIDVVLLDDLKNIDEVVVVGYGTQKKSLVTGSIARVDATELVKGSALRVNQAIQGKTAGVVIRNNSGQPGAFVSMNIRGSGTNGDNEPLYVVDGMPTNGYGIDYLSASDIQSIEVLKDAASAAIYGARAANGVVLITTKTGKTTKKAFEVTYDQYTGIQNPWKKMDVLNKNQYIEMQNEMAANAGSVLPYPKAIADTLTANTDWQNQMFNYNAPKNSYTLGFSGGSDKNTFNSALSYFTQDGIVGKGKSNFERLTYRLNSKNEFGFLTLNSSFVYANIKTKGIDANDRYGISLAQAVNMPPIIPVTYPSGAYAFPFQYGLPMQEITNPAALLSIKNSTSQTDKIVGGLSADFDFNQLSPILKGLKFKTGFGLEIAYVNNRSFDPVYFFGPTKFNDFTSVNESVDKYGRWNLENVITYDKTIDQSHITLLLGHSAFRDWGQNVYGIKKSLIFNDFEHAYLDNAKNDLSAQTGGQYNEHTVLSYFGRVNYDFAGKYMLTGILRRDGSSRFGGNNKFGYFPSISAGWNVTNESFFPQGTIVNNLKIRGSWGQNGNESIGDFAYTSKMGTGNIYYFGVNPTQFNGAQPDRIANPNLKWETSEQSDLAFDLGLFSNKLTLTIDYYMKTTKDWIVEAPVPLMMGNTPPLVNGGTIKNSGLEFELNYKQKVNEINFDFAITGAYNKNEVTQINNSEKVLLGGDGGFGQANIIRAEVGQPIGYFYGRKVAGVFQTEEEVKAYVGGADGKTLMQPLAKPGDFKWVDVNGDGLITDADRTKLGKAMPDFTGGFNLNVNWKGVDVNMFWYAALGQQVWMAMRRYDMNPSNYTTDWYENRWTGAGSTNEYPRITNTDDNNNLKTPSDFYVKDADYLRLKNLSIGYSFPQSVIKYLKLSKLRFYVSGENLITLTKYPGYEPEIGGGVFGSGVDRGLYPQAKTVLFGLNLSF